ncbi:MAG: response regulator transcription factor [Parcubacteria group bacterium]|nr:response regulator transcription factor [Parcubacteria group bacterium]
MVTPFAATRDVATKSLSSPVLPRQPNTLAILVVEDDRLLRNLIVKMLTHEGLVTDAAVDGREALEKVAKSSYRLILLDLILPDLDGFEVLQRLKANPASSKIPVVICSNLGQEDEIARGKELGAVDYLIKANFTPDEIVSKIREIL